MQVLHYMGMWWAPEALEPGQCTVRRGGVGEQGSWWMLWFCVQRDDNGKPLVAAIPINVGGGYIENGPGGKTWGIEYVNRGSHGWDISPSINILSSELPHPGSKDGEQSIWHHNDVKVINVPDDDQWTGGGAQGRRIRWIQPIGRRGDLRVYWDSVEYKDGITVKYLNTCPNAMGYGRPGMHDTSVVIGKIPNRTDDDLFGLVTDYGPEKWPSKCEHCGTPVPPGEVVGPLPEKERVFRDSIPIASTPDGFTGVHLYGQRQLFETTLWNTPSGEIEVADAFWAVPEGKNFWYSHDAGQCPYWKDKCDGRHLRIKLPDGHIWDVMSMASNCDLRDDLTHRCWEVFGSVEGGTLSIKKQSGRPTCTQGAGSIQTDRYHGMVVNGVLTP